VPDALSQFTDWEYDPAGNVEKIRRTDRTTESKTHDPMKRVLTQKDDAMNRTTTFTYWPSGMLKTVKDAENHLTQFQYDARSEDEDDLSEQRLPGMEIRWKQ
jgi:YD repeat-containing protein